MKNLLLASLLSVSVPALAEVLAAPQACPPDQLSIHVNNLAATDTEFWLQVDDHGDLQEKHLSLSAHSEIKLLGSDWLRPGQTLRVKHFAGWNLHATLSCAGQVPFEMDNFVAPLVSFNGLREGAAYRFQVMSLAAAGGQSVHLRWKDEHGALLDEGSLRLEEQGETKTFEFTAVPGAAVLEVEGEGRLNARLVDNDWRRTLPAHTPAAVSINVPTDATYFLVTNDSGSDSFVISLRDPALIAQAREIVHTKAMKMTVARIEAAPAFSENRDFSRAEASPWSWRVAKVTGFADLASIDCSGSPSLVEERLKDWLTHPQICFWTYRLKTELSPTQVANGTLQP